MANDLSARPLKIDTTMTVGANLGRPLRVVKVIWLNPGTIGDTFTITDPTSGQTLLTGSADTANKSQTFDFPVPRIWKDFKVVLTGTTPGVIYIYQA